MTRRHAAAGRGPALALAALLVAGCGGKKPAPAPPTPAPAPTAAAAAPPGGGATLEAQLELTRAVLAYTVTDKVIDAIAASDAELRDFWANPAEARKIRGQVTLPGILAGIDSVPRVKETLARHGLSPRDYVLGTFAMLGTYGYEKARMADPRNVEGKKPPVNDATLALLRKRFQDVERIVLEPPPAATKR